MNKYELEYRLRSEGINGLTIRRRKNIEKGDQPIGLDIPEQKDDLRLYTSMGVIKPVEDYWISGNGREPLGVREVQTQVSGMKKYALLTDVSIKPEHSKSKRKKEKQPRPTGMGNVADYSVMHVYSEGIDFRKMAEDEAYAEAVIGLLQEERLRQKQAQSQQLGLKTIYLGTIAESEKGYIKAGIRDYIAAITGIEFDIKKRQEEANKKAAERLENEKRRGIKREINSFTSGFGKQDWIEMMKKMVSSCGMAESADILKKALDQLENPEQALQDGVTPDEDDEWVY